MRKGTNLKNKLWNFLIKGIIPAIIILSFIIQPNDILDDTAKNDANKNNTQSSISNKFSDNESEISNSVYVLSDMVYETPEDIKKIMKSVKDDYEKLSCDGKILSYDYSKHNATAEYDGIYLRNTTKSYSVDIGKMLNKKVYASISQDAPAVLIYHTHSSESYELLEREYYAISRSSRSADCNQNVIRVGRAIKKTLEEKGFKVIHDETIYDEALNGAYDRSRERVTEILKENPSIQIVLDIHRDAIYMKDETRIKTVTEIDGQKAAQIMITTGCEDGNVTDFPNWEKNLTFALNLQKALVDDNPTLMRPLVFTGRKYNMDLLPCALHIEIGTDANTLEEAVYSAELFSQSLSELLKEYVI